MSMRAILAAILLFTTTLLGGDFTNGVFYTDSNVECVLVTQTGGSTTNILEAGRTYQVGNAIVELRTTNQTVIHFSGGSLLQMGAGSELSILLFDQEIENLNANPQRAKFGNHTLNLGLAKGEFCIIYPNKDANSRININTHYADYELTGGKYYFRVGKSSLVYVLEGGMTVHGDKSKVDIVEKGSLAVAVPFSDPDSGLEDKFVTSFKKAKADEMERFASPILVVEKKSLDVDFFVIGGKVIGFRLK